MRIFGSNELKEDVIAKGLCIGCGACINLCPYFKSYKGRTASLFPCTVEQGRCFAFCPKVEVDLEELSERTFGRAYDPGPLGAYREVRIARAGQAVGSGQFQAGGTVSALMCFALSQGIIDAAVLTDRDELLPVPTLARTAEEVLACAASKYTAAPTLAALNEAVKAGSEKLGVVATPCQTMAAAVLRQNPLNQENFRDPIALLVGLFCTWSLDYRAFEAYVAERVDIAKVRKVDIPPPPAEVLEIYTDNGKITTPLDEIRALTNDTCGYCLDMTAEFSDLSVGVLEGRADRNTLVIRTERGAEIAAAAEKAGYLVTENMPAENLEHLKWAAGNKKKRALARIQEAGGLNTAEDAGHAMVRMTAEAVAAILG